MLNIDKISTHFVFRTAPGNVHTTFETHIVVLIQSENDNSKKFNCFVNMSNVYFFTYVAANEKRNSRKCPQTFWKLSYIELFISVSLVDLASRVDRHLGIFCWKKW